MKIAPNFKIKGRKINTGEGNITHIREGPEARETIVNVQTGPVKP